MICEHAQHDDPRFSNTCIKCGQVVFRPRNKPLEALLHRHAELPQDLLDLVAARSAQWPRPDVLDAGKDFVAEAKEEIADLVNYLTWRMQEVTGDEYTLLHHCLRLVGDLWVGVRNAGSMGEGWL